MSKTKLIAALLLVSVSFAPKFLGQIGHASLPEQCIADYNLWSGEQKDGLERLPLTVIQPREIEMWDCASVVGKSPIPAHDLMATEMLLLYGTYSGIISHRALNFIQRHGLMKDFSQEDATGKR